MAPSRKAQRSVSLREETVSVPDRMPDLHRIWLSSLFELCLAEGIAYYVGRWTASGRVSFYFYADETKLEGFLLASDDPGKVVLPVAERLFGPKLAETMARLAERRLAGKPSEAR